MDIYWLFSLLFAILCVPLSYFNINIVGGLYKFLPIAWWIVFYALLGFGTPPGYIAILLILIFIVNVVFCISSTGNGIGGMVLVVVNIILLPMGFGILILEPTIDYLTSIGNGILNGVTTLSDFVIAVAPYVVAIVVILAVIWYMLIWISAWVAGKKYARRRNRY